jgi:hypothetical protein
MTERPPLILKRNPVGDNQEDYSVLENGVIVGRIYGAGRTARPSLDVGERAQSRQRQPAGGKQVCSKLTNSN